MNYKRKSALEAKENVWQSRGSYNLTYTLIKNGIGSLTQHNLVEPLEKLCEKKLMIL
jgi:hypothetical protein